MFMQPKRWLARNLVRCLVRSLVVAPLAFAGVASFADLAVAGCGPQDDVLAALRCVPGLTAEEVVPSTVDGYRQFELELTQPVDHFARGGGAPATFAQRLVLLHKSWDDPMVLQTSGYQIFSVGLAKLAKTFGANQIQVEHRYFAGSTPAPLDWTKLDIEQSAADFHAVVEALKPLYGKPWVGTGASKGGMTSVFHRRFYPGDLDGTVADVAPLSFSKDDQRYVTWVDEVGGKPWADCRAKLEALQTTLLERRGELEDRIQGDFTRLGDADTGFEHAVIEMPFVFWQYGAPTDAEFGCDKVPGASATPDELWAFLDHVNSVDGYGDSSFDVFQSYYFQAGTQLGGPGSKLSHLGALRTHPYSLDMYMPVEARDAPYANTAMRDVEAWVRDASEHLLFVYGEYDPWSAGAYPSVEKRDVHRFYVPAGNHGSKFDLLAADDKAVAIASLTAWFGREPVVDLEKRRAEPSLDEVEAAAKRRLHLP
jgi:hypothetical protein